jgi:hypothetical protein
MPYLNESNMLFALLLPPKLLLKQCRPSAFGLHPATIAAAAASPEFAFSPHARRAPALQKQQFTEQGPWG